MNYPVTLACLGFFGGHSLDLEETRKAGGYHGARPMDGVDFANAIDTVLGWYDPQITMAQLNLLDSHDTPRFITSVREDWSALKLAYLFLFTYPGAPCIYYGDEIGLTGGHDPECRRSFPWDESRWNHDILAHVKKLIALRARLPGLAARIVSAPVCRSGGVRLRALARSRSADHRLEHGGRYPPDRYSCRANWAGKRNRE